MTTVTIENRLFDLPDKFQTEKDLFEFLIKCFEDQTFLIKTSTKELCVEEEKAWYQHKKDGYNDFIDFQGR